MTVLVVDDQPVICRAIAARLEAHDGIEAVTACSRAEAVELIRRRRFDAALIDLCLPEPVGHELAELVVQTSPGARVVLMSCQAGRDALALADSVGVPFALKSLEMDAAIPYFLGESDEPESFISQTLDHVVRATMKLALLQTNGNISQAAELLGISRQMLRQRLGLEPDVDES
jgi:DNA-binding NtrC family response regulator